MRDRLEELPNIGPVLASRLREAGIMTPEQFAALGDDEAFTRLTLAFPEDACSHTRLALAGAIRGMRWRALPIALRRMLTEGLGLSGPKADREPEV